MLVLDANILIRAVLGSRVLRLLVRYAASVEFLAPDTAFVEAREKLPAILERRRVPMIPAMAVLDLLRNTRATEAAAIVPNSLDGPRRPLPAFDQPGANRRV